MDIEAWLRGLGLAEYADAFSEHAIDGHVLAELTDEDLREIGVVRVGHRRKLRAAIEARWPGTPADTGTPAPAMPLRGEAADLIGDAERRTLTMLFCDLVGSTPLAAQLDPEEMRDLIRHYQEACGEAIEQFDGHVAKYMGDGLLAYFGYPRAHENEAENAVRAAFALVEAVSRLSSPTGKPLAVRVGIATGLVVVGDIIGDRASQEMTAVGDTPALATRLQSLAEPNDILVSPTTRRLAGALFDYESLGERTLKGFKEPLEVWRALRERPVESRFAATHPQRIGSLIGRIQERALLVERWSIAKGGEGQVVFLAADPGIGKSRLVRDLLEHVQGEEHFRLAYQCLPHYTSSAFYPAVRQLEISAGFKPEHTPAERRDRLRRLLSTVPETLTEMDRYEMLLGLSGDSEGDIVPERLYQQILEALVTRVLAAAAIRPVLFFIEDMHWSDPSTLDVIGEVIERIAHERVLVVGTYRPEFVPPWSDHPHLTLIKLNHLTRAQSGAMITSLAGGRLPDGLFEEILEKTEGVPLFIEQVVQAILETGGLREQDGRYEPVDGDLRVTVPETLHDTLMSRLDRDETAKQVAQIASVIGREFSVRVLEGAVPTGAEALADSLDRLVRAGLIVRQRTSQDDLYAFKHGLLHEAAYNTLLLRTRQELHGLVAKRIEEVRPEIADARPEIVARHYTEAGQAERAAALWLEGGRRAVRSGAYSEAHGQLRAGLGLLQGLPDDDQRAHLELPLQMAYAETLRSARFTGGEDARDACQRARELCHRLGDRRKLIKVLRLDFGINFNRPDPERAGMVAREFLDLADRHNDPAALVLGETCSGCLAFFRGDLSQAREHLNRALAARPRLPTPTALADLQFPSTALIYLAWTEMLMGETTRARSLLSEAVEEVADGTAFSQSLTLANASLVCQTGRDLERLRRFLRRLKTLADDRGIPYWLNLVGFHQGYFSTMDGAESDGLTRMLQAIEIFRSNAVEIEIPFYLSLYAERLTAVGRMREALGALDEAVARIERTGEGWCLPEILRLRACVSRDRRPIEAAADLNRARALAAAQGAQLWQLRIALDDLSGGNGASDEARSTIEAVLARCPDLAAAVDGDLAVPGCGTVVNSAESRDAAD